MNATVPAVREKTQITAGAPVAAIVPQDLDQAFRLSQALAVSGLAPRGMDKPEQIMVAIMAGAELGLAPFQALQSFAVVNGRPTLWGDGLMAVVRGRGVKVKEWVEGDAEQMVAHCLVTRPDTGEEIERSFSVADAKKAGLWGKTGPWQQHTRRMMQMRARSYALRDGCADMLRGVQVREEVEDYTHVRDVTPARASGLAARLNGPTTDEGFTAAQAQADEPVHFAEQAEEVADAEFTAPADETVPADDFPGDRQEEANTAPPSGELTLAQRADAYEQRIKDAPSTVKLKAIRAAGEKLRADLDAGDPERLVELEELFNVTYAAREDEERAGA